MTSPTLGMLLTILVAILGLGHLPAVAQDLVPAKIVSVRDRPRPEYSPVGIPAGSFRLRPQLSIGGAYDDNIYATEADEVDDAIALVSAGATIASQGGRLPLSAYGNFSSQSYADHPAEDFVEWESGASVGYTLPRRTVVNLGGSYSENRESRGEPSSPALAAEPPKYQTGRVTLQTTHSFASGQLVLDANYESADFEAVRLEDGTLFSQDFRDREMLTVELQGGVVVGSSTSVFLRATHTDRDYTAVLTDGVDRDAVSQALYGGVAFDITNLMRGEVGVGVLELDNRDPGQGDSRTLAIRSNVDVYLTQLLTLTVNAQRTAAAADIAASSSYIATTVAVGLDYELRRNVILSTRFARSARDYTGIDQSITTDTVSFNAEWLLNRNLRLGLDYDLVDRDETQIGRSYSGNRISAVVRLSL